jgi:hypothetical protein
MNTNAIDNSRLLRYTLGALLVGVFLGAGSALALTHPDNVQAGSNGTVWGAYHAAIPYEAPKEPAPTF